MGTSITKPSCPRCGYDLSGIVDSWQASCPVEGICSECGHEFDWKDAYDNLYRLRRWFFEVCPSYRFDRVCVTWVRALWPPCFWKAVGKTQPRLGKAACGAAGLVLLIWVLNGVTTHIYMANSLARVRVSLSPDTLFQQTVSLYAPEGISFGRHQWYVYTPDANIAISRLLLVLIPVFFLIHAGVVGCFRSQWRSITRAALYAIAPYLLLVACQIALHISFLLARLGVPGMQPIGNFFYGIVQAELIVDWMIVAVVVFWFLSFWSSYLRWAGSPEKRSVNSMLGVLGAASISAALYLWFPWHEIWKALGIVTHGELFPGP